ncbi:extensin family protein [Telmatospirillum sp. J64-1]|uniref:extensin family protein n=1 Tax=Telmatospirillum sp. J64-1 TaxID=2502183 RepID=UPI00115D2F5A|nr:extensin family protein [Telmatospirillum sp. J64-1]
MGWGCRFWVLSSLAVLAACASPAPPPPPVAAIPVPAGPSCLQELESYRVEFETVPAISTPQGCGVDNPVRVTAAAIPWNRPSVVTCQMAATIHRFEAEVVQPAALKHFGRPATKVWHAGTYVCRNETGSRNRLSQHALGQAIDILGFDIEGGITINVKRNWNDGSAKSRFLRDVARGSCDIFNVVLTPRTDVFHEDHLHLDIGPYRRCDA